MEVARGSAGALDAFATISAAANSETNKEATTRIGISSGVSMRGSVGLCGYLLDLAAKGTYYLNCKTGQASTMVTYNVGHTSLNELELIKPKILNAGTPISALAFI